MKNPKYTFLLPAYKSQFLDEMLHSIQSQTYKDFKVVISDDCSPEDLRSICEPYLADPRFTYRRNKENIGSKSLVAHWNLLVEMCDTDYFIMASDDDVYEPQFLEEIDKLVTKYPNVDLYRGRACKIDGKHNVCFNEELSAEYLDALHFMERFYKPDFVACVSNYCYRTTILKEKGGFIDFPKAWFSDDATNFLMANNGCAITMTEVFCFRKTQYQISSQWGVSDDCEKKTDATIKFYQWMSTYLNNYEDCDLKDEINQSFKYKVYGNIQNHIYHCSFLKFLLAIYQSPSDIGLSKLRALIHYVNYYSRFAK